MFCFRTSNLHDESTEYQISDFFPFQNPLGKVEGHLCELGGKSMQIPLKMQCKVVRVLFNSSSDIELVLMVI